ncbi:MAG: histidine kinase dimerization/phosphoacceptor domain -containing protein [Flavobacteriales bacterium]
MNINISTMIQEPINLLEELDSASNMHSLKRDDIDALMLEFAKRITSVLKIERTNVWLFNEDKDAIVSIGEYDSRTRQFSKNNIIYRKDCPNYFKAISQNKIICVKNVLEHPYTNEFNNTYSIPNNVISLMDVPLRISSELIGVFCFEKTGEIERIFKDDEQTFAMSLAIVVASNLEARHRRVAQRQLELALSEKELLIKEINHRVKNNLSILISLLRLAKNQSKNAKIPDVLNEFEQRVMAMVKIHDLLHQTENYTTIKLADYIHELAHEFKHSFNQIKMQTEIKSVALNLNSKIALHIGLAVTEILLNSIKYGDLNDSNYYVFVKLSKINDNIILTIGNNGKSFDFEKKLQERTLGLSLIKDLIEDLDINIKYPTKEKCSYELTF